MFFGRCQICIIFESFCCSCFYFFFVYFVKKLVSPRENDLIQRNFNTQRMLLIWWASLPIPTSEPRNLCDSVWFFDNWVVWCMDTKCNLNDVSEREGTSKERCPGFVRSWISQQCPYFNTMIIYLILSYKNQPTVHRPNQLGLLIEYIISRRCIDLNNQLGLLIEYIISRRCIDLNNQLNLLIEYIISRRYIDFNSWFCWLNTLSADGA